MQSKVVFLLTTLLILVGSIANSSAIAREQKSEESPFVNFGKGEDEIDAIKNRIDKAFDQGNYDECRKLAEQVVELSRVEFGESHPETIQAINNFGFLLQQTHDFIGARNQYERALKLHEQSHQKEDRRLAAIYNNLAALLAYQSDFDEALPLYEKALAVQKAALGEVHPDTAKTLFNIAVIMENRGNQKESMERFQRCLTILEETRGSDHPDLANVLISLAKLYSKQNEPEKAEQNYLRALEIREKVFGKSHPEVAESLCNLAHYQWTQGKTREALDKWQQALQIFENAEGPDHPDVGEVLNELGSREWLLGSKEIARNHFLRAADIITRYSETVLPMLSFAEQRAFLERHGRDECSILLSAFADSPEQVKQSYDRLSRWKGMLIESLRRQSSLEKLTDNPELKPRIARLRQLRNEIANWFQEAGNVSFAEWETKNRQLTHEKELLERELAKAMKSAAEITSAQQVYQCLKPDEVLFDIFHFRQGTVQSNDPYRYAAIFCTSQGASKQIDLGSAKEIDAMLRDWRRQVLVKNPGTAQWKALREKLWQPLAASLPPNTNRIFVSTDLELSRIPWQVFLMDDAKTQSAMLAQLDSARELVSLRARTDTQQTGAQERLLLVGGVAFGKNSESIYVFPELPGTVEEAKMVETLAKNHGLQVDLVSGAAASKSKILSLFGQSDRIHLATHGVFFDESSETNPITLATGSSATASKAVSRNPLVESGLVFAPSEKHKGAGDQFLTAEELVGTDLSKCRLITLSACETGLGGQTTGQGVLGLRSAIMSAGARCILMSLWKVPDESTFLLMQRFNSNLWDKKMPAAQALQQAQLSVRNEPLNRYVNPIEWAGWVLVGEAW